MRKHVLALTTSALIVACGAMSGDAQAQAPNPQIPEQQQSPGALQDGYGGGGMMDRGMLRRGMMGQGPGGMGPGSMAPIMMRMIFSLVDADGDGKLSLQEFQAAHERIFRAMDANKDGFVTLEEMQAFIRGTSAPPPQQ